MMKKKGTAALMMALAILGVGIASPDAAIAKKKSCNRASSCSKSKDIVDTAKCDGSFKTLSHALNTSGLSKTLKSKGPFTVFAPSDEAFGKLPKEQRDALLADNKKLPTVLKYHVVKGIVPASELAQKRSVVTVEGESLMVDTKNDGELIVVDGAMVTKPDIKCNNGVIHVIDYVLTPERGK